MCETNKPPAMRVHVEGYTKKLRTRYNKGVQAHCRAKREIFHRLCSYKDVEIIQWMISSRV